MTETKAEIKCEVVNSFGILSESPRGWRKEFKLVSWNDREPRFDIREWSPDSDKMSRGITLSKEEVLNLKQILLTLPIETELQQ